MIIFYTGVGSNEKVYHSIDKFLQIMRENFELRDWQTVPQWEREVRLEFRNRILPQEFPLFNLDDWVSFSGASKLEVEADEPLIEQMNNNFISIGN